ncbi:ornithine cyclodeaminase family protein [Nocardia sp. 004]|uniref:ornithine cyclodeaminase family protein n=1 Tax=Nocardia sp. 004 TaxID=3385978 RepID=UPI0039A083EF
MDTLVLGREDLRRILDIVGADEIMDRVIDCLRRRLADLGRGDCVNSPARTGFTLMGDQPGVVENMPHYAHGDSLTIKTIAYSPHNGRKFNLPTVLGAVTRFEEESGMLTAIADATLITAIRTGAASSIASSLLANRDSTTFGIVGAGAQSVTQLHALSRVFDIREVLVFDTKSTMAESLPSRTPFLDANFVMTDPAEIVRRADVICTATSVRPQDGPVIPDVPHRPHLHINAVGADEVGKIEIPLSLLQRAFVCVDHLEQALAQGESQKLGRHEIGVTLDVLSANPHYADHCHDQLTVFDSTGFAFEDHHAFDVFLELAQELGLGEKLPIMLCPVDVCNPYS